MRFALFDNDGTIADTRDLILSSMRHATKSVLGRTIPDERLLAKVGIPLDDQMRDFAESEEQSTELLRVYRTHNHAAHDAAIRLFPGEVEALAALRDAGVRMGVVTSKRHALAQHGLEVLGISDYFECLIGAQDCERHKPDPGPVLAGMECMGAVPDECAYVGDSVFDIQAGKAARCLSVAVSWGIASEDELMSAAPDVFCRSFEELVAVLTR